MKFRFLIIALIVLTSNSAFAPHKFYVALHQVKYAEDKKMIQVMSRLFVDDLNNALEKKYKIKTLFGEKVQGDQDVPLLKKYISETFTMKVNGKPAPLTLFTTEMENNVLICYIGCRDIGKIKTLEIENKMLTDLVTEQQNIIQTTVYGKKENTVLTAERTSVLLSYP